jgi:multiple sugar transport system permease protein
MSRLQARRTLTGYLFLSPAILFFLVFLVGPMLFGLFISTRDWNMLQPPFASRSVGLNNYRGLLLDDEVFRLSLVNTFLYAVGTMLPLIVLALLLALALNQPLALRALFRTAYFVPVVTSAVAVSIVWGYLYNPVYGPINAALDLLGLPTQRWLTSAELALPSVMLMGIWKGIGYYMVIFLAGLQNVPREYYEAARVDGASPRHTFWHITVPLLKPTTMFVFITAAIYALQVFTPVFILTHGGPANASNVLVLYMYDTAFLYLKMGRAAAMAFVLFVILLVVTVVQLRFFREGGVRSY